MSFSLIYLAASNEYIILSLHFIEEAEALINLKPLISPVKVTSAAWFKTFNLVLFATPKLYLGLETSSEWL